MEPNLTPSPYTREFSTVKIVLLAESKPFSSDYLQVVMTHQQLQVLASLVTQMFPKNAQGLLEMKTKYGFQVTLPDDIESFYA